MLYQLLLDSKLYKNSKAYKERANILQEMAAVSTTFPFLTAYDPPGTSEGSLDPLGLYQIADQLAVMLVPAIRERMQRIRFLTAMAVGALVTEGMDDDPELRDASPYLVWEWLVVEAIVRTKGDDSAVWGVPGTHVAGRALNSHGYLDARSYLILRDTPFITTLRPNAAIFAIDCPSPWVFSGHVADIHM